MGFDRFDLRAFLTGMLLPPVLLAGLACATVLYWPEAEGVRTIGRMLDSLVPQLLLLGLAGAALLAALRAFRAAAAGFLVILLAGGLLVGRHLAQSAPLDPGRPADLTVLWFNMLGSNPTPPETLAAALAASPADLIILGEAQPLRNHLDRLAAAFPGQAGCRDRRCDVLVLWRRDGISAEVLRMGRAQEERLARVTVAVPDRAPLTVLAAHLVKPWFFGFSEADEWSLYQALAAAGGPLLLTGDFNAAPWSRRLQQLVRDCDLDLARRPVASWPVSAGPFGVPIDNMLTRGGAVPVGIEPWGAGLGSNHRGILMRLALPGTQADGPARPRCAPPKTPPGTPTGTPPAAGASSGGSA